MQFLCTELPESIVDCEKQGQFKLAEKKIKVILEKDIPEPDDRRDWGRR